MQIELAIQPHLNPPIQLQPNEPIKRLRSKAARSSILWLIRYLRRISTKLCLLRRESLGAPSDMLGQNGQGDANGRVFHQEMSESGVKVMCFGGT